VIAVNGAIERGQKVYVKDARVVAAIQPAARGGDETFLNGRARFLGVPISPTLPEPLISRVVCRPLAM
jgi:hypothetical protein